MSVGGIASNKKRRGRPPKKMIEMLSLKSSGHSENQIREMMKIPKHQWAKYRTRYEHWLAKNYGNFGTYQKSTSIEPTHDEGCDGIHVSETEGKLLQQDHYAPANPLMWDNSLGSDECKVIDMLSKKGRKGIIRDGKYALKKMFKPMGDDDVTRRALSILAKVVRDRNLPWRLSTDLASKLRRIVKSLVSNDILEAVVNELLSSYTQQVSGDKDDKKEPL